MIDMIDEAESLPSVLLLHVLRDGPDQRSTKKATTQHNKFNFESDHEIRQNGIACLNLVEKNVHDDYRHLPQKTTFTSLCPPPPPLNLSHFCQLGALCIWLVSATFVSRPCGCSNLSKIGAIIMKL
jgi:hypothetical protein